MARFPEMAFVEQQFDPQRIEDVAAVVREETAKLRLERKVKSGDTVAVTAGSRGISQIDVMIGTIIAELKKLQAKPFIFPAMGSHGGATAEGQIKVLAGLGITEEKMGCPILSEMEPVYLGDAALGYPVNVDRNAMAADHIVVVNRVKPHTKFEGPIESGLMKMMAIGMGKRKGAEYYHKAAIRLTFQKIVETVGTEVLKRCPILFGLGAVENAFHAPCEIRAFPPEEMLQGEIELLLIAKKRMALLPFDEIDILIVDRIGKDISGTGMDTNVTGRNRDLLGDFLGTPRVKRIFVRDLTEKTGGNAIGIGFADFTTTRLVEKIDRQKTWINCITAISPEKGAIPIHFDSDREVLEACFDTIGDIRPEDARVVHIENTNQLTRISVSKACKAEILASPRADFRSGWKEFQFDAAGNLLHTW